MSKANIVFFDIETTPVEYYKWQYDRNPYINAAGIKNDWYIISACWKTHGKAAVNSVAIDKPGDDYNVVKTLREALETADVIVGHCVDRFDLRNLNTRLVYHGLKPLPIIPTVDTKKVASRFFGFTSNKLDYLAKFLGVGEKIETEYGLWISVINGSKAALSKMVKYNKHDVVINEKVYDKMLPFMRNHPHVGAMKGKDRHYSCPTCGSEEIKLNGIRYTAAGVKKQEIQCKKCHHYAKIPYALEKK